MRLQGVERRTAGCSAKAAAALTAGVATARWPAACRCAGAHLEQVRVAQALLHILAQALVALAGKGVPAGVRRGEMVEWEATVGGHMAGEAGRYG